MQSKLRFQYVVFIYHVIMFTDFVSMAYAKSIVLSDVRADYEMCIGEADLEIKIDACTRYLDDARALEMLQLRDAGYDHDIAIAFRHRGRAHWLLQNWYSARSDMDTAIALNPTDATALIERALTFFQSDFDYDAAEIYYDAALRIDPNSARAFNNRGILHFERGNLDGAMADFAAAILNDPRFDLAWANRGNVHRERGNFDAALAEYIALNPQEPWGFLNRGILHGEQRNLAAALADLTEAIALDAGLALAFVRRGAIHRALGDRDAAMTDYNAALRLRPRYAEALYVVAPERSGRSGCQDGTDELPGGPVSQGAMWVDLVVVGEPDGQ